ncbi:hypothetical protein [Ferrovibrio sp.]|uniref:hypothetical protein n=1 Tax=Ferrovibrio sp. TaxID=1917215 RepID=UPI00311F9C3F
MKRWDDLEKTMNAKAAELAITREEKLLMANPTADTMKAFREALRLAQQSWERSEVAAGREILDKDQAREHFSRERDFIAYLSTAATLQSDRESGKGASPGWLAQDPDEHSLWSEVNEGIFFEHRARLHDDRQRRGLADELRREAGDVAERQYFSSIETGELNGADAISIARRLETTADKIEVLEYLRIGRTQNFRTGLDLEQAWSELTEAWEHSGGGGIGYSVSEMDLKWGRAQPVNTLESGEGFLSDRAVSAHDLRQSGGALMVPMRDIDGTLHDIQLIDRMTGRTTFANGHRAPGLMHLIDPDSMLGGSAGGNVGRDHGARVAQNAVFITRSYEEASTIQKLTSRPVAVAFSERNMVAVAEAIKGKFPQADVVILGEDRRDLDNLGRKSEGMRQAAMAAAAADGTVLYPEVTALERVLGVGNWNEIALHRGRSDAKKSLMQQLGANEPEKDHGKSGRRDRHLERQLEKTPFIKRAVQRMRDGIGL